MRARPRARVFSFSFLLSLFLLGGCACPDYRPTFEALDEAFSVLQKDYDGTAVAPPNEEEAKKRGARRLALIKKARKVLSEARKASR